MSFKDYQVKGNPVIDVPIPRVANLEFDELGKEVVTKYNELFKGTRAKHDHKYKTGQPVSYSNVPFALWTNQLLMEQTDGRISLLSPSQVVQYFDKISERNDTYSDTNAITIYPNQGSNEDLRQRVLGIIGKKSTKVPLIVENLGVEKADNDYGFTFTETDNLQVTEASFLKKGGNLIYTVEKGLESSDDGVQVWTPISQSGLRRLYRDGTELSARYVNLLDSKFLLKKRECQRSNSL